MANGLITGIKRVFREAVEILAETPAVFHDEKRLTRLQRFIHFWALVMRSFVRNRCPVRASALAYASILALIPLLAVIASVSASVLKSGGDKAVDQFIDRLVVTVTPSAASNPGTPAIDDATRREIVLRINEFVANVQTGTLGMTGMAMLIFVAISMLARIEDTFNDIWGVPRGRSWYVRIVHYWAALTLGPILLTLALAITSGSQFKATEDFLRHLPIVGGRLLKVMLELSPYAILSLTFALFYQLLPNTKVQWRAAFAGGLVGGSLWQLNNMFSVFYVSRVVTNSKIYGSLGMVPVVMIGLYFSWFILLFGAQVAYAYQNRRTYFQEKQVEIISQRGREFVALRLMTDAARRHLKGERPATTLEIADEIGVPSRLVSQMLQPLLANQLLVEIAGADAGYAPARPPEKITCKDVLKAIRDGTGQGFVMREDEVRRSVEASYLKIEESAQKVSANITLAELANETGHLK